MKDYMQQARAFTEKLHLKLVPSYRELMTVRQQLAEKSGEARIARDRAGELETELRDQQVAFESERRGAARLQSEVQERHVALEITLAKEREQYETERAALVAQRNNSQQEARELETRIKNLEEQLDTTQQGFSTFKASALGRWITSEQLQKAGLDETLIRQWQSATARRDEVVEERDEAREKLRRLEVAQVAFVATVSGEYEPPLKRAPFAVYSLRGNSLYETRLYRRGHASASAEVKSIFGEEEVRQQLRAGTKLERDVGECTLHCVPYRLTDPLDEDPLVAVYILPKKETVSRGYLSKLRGLATQAIKLFERRTEQLQQIREEPGP